MEEAVRKQIRHLTRPGLVAVSGGADSCALSLILKNVSPVPITIVHVNHHLRGQESDDDQRFVQSLALQTGIPCRTVSRPVEGDSRIEISARELRYQWFQEVAEECQCGWLATGHTADDQAETVLHRLIRGTGIAGLGGIPPERAASPDSNLTIIRPLLTLRRNDLLEYLRERNQPFRTDSSNHDERFTRNRIRHELLPLLTTYNPRIVEAVTRLAEQSRETSDWIESCAEQLLARARRPDAGEITVLDAECLAAESPFLVRAAFQRLWCQKNWPLGEMTAEHWQRLAQRATADYPGGISVRCVGKVVQIRRKS
ncbi:MAG: tRNA lysidine(34) synthetase TilS [Gemmataceae bacterium]